jgi:hypothetical protein
MTKGTRMTLKKLLTGTAVVGLLVGCTVTVGPGGDGGNGTDSGGDGSVADSGKTDGGGGDAGICPAIPALVYFDNPQGTGTCDQCMASKCCALTTACFSQSGDAGSDTCSDYDNCMAACDGLTGGAYTACVSSCDGSHPTSKATWTPYNACMGNSCGQECGLTGSE